MFEALFKFNRINYSEGSVGLLGEHPILVFTAVVAIGLAGMVLLYRSSDRFANRKQAATSFALRAGVLILLCLPLLEPILAMPDIVPDENFVAVLVDASESMNVSDGRNGQTRRDEIRGLLLEGDHPVAPALEEYFKVRYYAFGEEARRLDSAAAPGATEHATNVSSALDRVLSDFRGLPLAGVVLLTDGADNSTGVPRNSAEELRARDVPLHVIGVGDPEARDERELLETVVNRGVEVTTAAEIDVKLRSWRDESDPVELTLSRGDDIVHSENVTLKGGGKIDQLTLTYEPDGDGPSEYTLAVAQAPGERNSENNAANILIDPGRDTLRVLYIEGHPRREFKFIKRALEDDAFVHFSSILRTGTGKFYRQGIRHSDELSGGFPTSEAELFGYDAVLFGDVEASHFSIDQLRMMERFVRVRGGGFAMLGGRLAFAEGGYWDNPIADLLPVHLDPDRRVLISRALSDREGLGDERGFVFSPTPIGLENPILRLAGTPPTNQVRWEDMPRLTSINYFGAVKPGAAVLAEMEEGEQEASEPLLVIQRYGKGRSAALGTASTWRWQMQLDADDQRHERFWRQFVRWLAASAPDPVDVDLAGDRFAPGDEVPVRIDIYDEGFAPLDGAALRGQLTNPAGEAHEVSIRTDLGRTGSYTTVLTPHSEGVHTFEVEAVAGERPIGRATRTFLVRPPKSEYTDAVLKQPFLEHLAEDAGGFYYDVDNAHTVAENVRSRRTSTSIYRVDYLWDLPILFAMALVLWSSEWIWRRRKGLP